MNILQSVTPFYFRLAERPLFGCFHQPPPARRRRCGVVICQPVGHEYVNSHRALRQLAVRLAENGFPVLRFDYYGTGDSYGNNEDGAVEQWLEDITSAITELKNRAHCSEICLVGLRLGAALAWLASQQRDDIGSLILWDPVENGKEHLQELLLLQKEMLRFHPKQAAQEHGECLDVLGFRFSRVFISGLGKINLQATRMTFAKKVLIIRGNNKPDNGRLHTHLAQSNGAVEQKHMPAPPFWQPNAEGSLFVPARLIQAIVTWSCEACS